MGIHEIPKYTHYRNTIHSDTRWLENKTKFIMLNPTWTVEHGRKFGTRKGI